MAKPKSEPTPAMKAAEKARAAYDAARKLHAKQANDANLKAVATARTALSEATTKVNRERFENIAGGRVAKALTVIGSLRNCANRRSYQYESDDVSTMFTALETELKNAKAEFDKALTVTPSDKKATGAAKFTFGK